MRQVKLFKGVEMELSALEAEINAWIREHGATVHQISGNISPQSHAHPGQDRLSGSDVLIIVEYEA